MPNSEQAKQRLGAALERRDEPIAASGNTMKRVEKQSRWKIAQANHKTYALSEEERRLVREGIAELDRGEAATEAEVRAIFDKYRGEDHPLRSKPCARVRSLGKVPEAEDEA